MKPEYINQSTVSAFISAALLEDVGDGDHSSLAAVPASASNRAQLLFKSDGIVAGIDLAKDIFTFIDPKATFKQYFSDGQPINAGQTALEVEGNAQAILKAERLVLNCMQRMSGIATYTNQLVDLLQGTKARLLDTRKTTPNFRMMEKWAVVIGGGMNHRFGLFDLIMLKDNHIDFAGGISAAVAATKLYLAKTGRQLRIEVETRNLAEVAEALNTNAVDIIMLDNMSVKDIKKALELIDGQCQTEASGGITEKNLRQIALTGVDFVSVGATIHSAKPLDISLKAIKN